MREGAIDTISVSLTLRDHGREAFGHCRIQRAQFLLLLLGSLNISEHQARKRIIEVERRVSGREADRLFVKGNSFARAA